MGYFDALTSGSFKITEDGQQLFFPWGSLGGGYDVPSEQEFERLRRSIKTYLVVSLPLIIATGIWKGYLGGLVILPILIVPYILWAQYQCRRLHRTNVKLTLSESFDSQARAHNTVVLWLLEILALLFVVAGFAVFALDSSNWLIALASITFFGLCAVAIGRMLIIKMREGRSRS